MSHLFRTVPHIHFFWHLLKTEKCAELWNWNRIGDRGEQRKTFLGLLFLLAWLYAFGQFAVCCWNGWCLSWNGWLGGNRALVVSIQARLGLGRCWLCCSGFLVAFRECVGSKTLSLKFELDVVLIGLVLKFLWLAFSILNISTSRVAIMIQGLVFYHPSSFLMQSPLVLILVVF